MIPKISTMTLKEALSLWSKEADFLTHIDTAFASIAPPPQFSGGTYSTTWASKWFMSLYEDWQLIDKIDSYNVLKALFDKYYFKARSIEYRKINYVTQGFGGLFSYEKRITRAEASETTQSNTVDITSSKDIISSETLVNQPSTNTSEKETKNFYAPADTHALTDATMKDASTESLSSVVGLQEGTKTASSGDDSTSNETASSSIIDDKDVTEEIYARQPVDALIKLQNEVEELFDKFFRYFYPMFYGVI
jgi:hypothetical protein